MKKRNILILVFIIIFIILILLGIFIYKQFRIPHIGEFYIRNATDNEFSDEENQEICRILNLNDIDIYKIACEVEYENQGSYYIFFYSSKQLMANDIDDSFELYALGYENEVYDYAIGKLGIATYSDSDYSKIFDISKNNYRWWKNNEKTIDRNELQNHRLVELTTIYDENGYALNSLDTNMNN